MTRRRILIAVGVAGVVALALALLPIQVCRDWGFIDRNTGSRKGYREWFFGWRTSHWQRESAVETFMRAKYPTEFRQDWVSYEGTGRNIFGVGMLYGHGRPGPVVLLSPDLIADYCRDASETEKRRLYDVFAGGEREQIMGLVDHIYETAKRTEKNQ